MSTWTTRIKEVLEYQSSWAEYLTDFNSTRKWFYMVLSLSLRGGHIHKTHTLCSRSEAVQGRSSIQIWICLALEPILLTTHHPVFFVKHNQPMFCFTSNPLFLWATKARAFISLFKLLIWSYQRECCPFYIPEQQAYWEEAKSKPAFLSNL